MEPPGNVRFSKLFGNGGNETGGIREWAKKPKKDEKNEKQRDRMREEEGERVKTR